MTTICTDGLTLAADMLMNADGKREAGYISKIRKIDDMLFALTGTTAMFGPLIEWYRAGHDVAAIPLGDSDRVSWCFWVFTKEGLFEMTKSVPIPLRVTVPNAMGSGADEARGAMMMGASPRLAVQVAGFWDVNTDGVESVELIYPIARGAAFELFRRDYITGAPRPDFVRETRSRSRVPA